GVYRRPHDSAAGRAAGSETSTRSTPEVVAPARGGRPIARGHAGGRPGAGLERRRGSDRPAATDPRIHPWLGGAARLSAERAGNRRGGRPGVPVERGLPTQG